eukprot:scaffold74454_cov65-Phaeocystis_antarctica.AAC.6
MPDRRAAQKSLAPVTSSCATMPAMPIMARRPLLISLVCISLNLAGFVIASFLPPKKPASPEMWSSRIFQLVLASPCCGFSKAGIEVMVSMAPMPATTAGQNVWRGRVELLTDEEAHSRKHGNTPVFNLYLLVVAVARVDLTLVRHQAEGVEVAARNRQRGDTRVSLHVLKSDASNGSASLNGRSGDSARCYQAGDGREGGEHVSGGRPARYS